MKAQVSFLKILCAWGVHLYTGTGLIVASAIATLIVRGGELSLYWSLTLMWVATFIDATDGYLARKARVKEVLPQFDGRRLDDLIDFITYTFLPLLLIWRASILPDNVSTILLIPLLASAYGFCQSNAKTDDGFFLGFPSNWNIVAFYLVILHPTSEVAIFYLLLFAVLTFVPVKYLYPSQPGKINVLTNILAAIWGAQVLWILVRLTSGESADAVYTAMCYSFFFPVYYVATSWLMTGFAWIRKNK